MSGKYGLHSLKFGSTVDEGTGSGGGVAVEIGARLSLELALPLVFAELLPLPDWPQEEQDAKNARPITPITRKTLIPLQSFHAALDEPALVIATLRINHQKLKLLTFPDRY